MAKVAPGVRLLGEHAGVVIEVRALGVDVGEGGDPDLERRPAIATSRTRSTAWSSPSGCGVHGGARAAGRVAAQREHGADPGRRVPTDDAAQLGA